jgi:hypothetical protein
MPGKQAGAKSVQQHEDGFALPDCLNMHRQAVDLDELATRIG